MRKVPGIHSVLEAIKVRPKSVSEVWIQKECLDRGLDDEIVRSCRKTNIKLKSVSRSTLDSIVQSHQGYVAMVNEGPVWPSASNLMDLKVGLIFVLDQISDPHNLGSIIRTAWNFSSNGILIPKDRASKLTPSAIKVASGGTEHVPVLEVSSLSSELKSLKDKGFWIYGLDSGDTQNGKRPVGLFDIKFPDKIALVLGSEEGGLRKPTLGECDEVVEIPHNASAESYNVAIAAAIAGYEFRRQKALNTNP